MVAKSSVRDGVDDRAHLVPQVFLCRHRSQNNDDEQRIEEKRGGEGGGTIGLIREGETQHVTTFSGRAIFLPHF